MILGTGFEPVILQFGLLYISFSQVVCIWEVFFGLVGFVPGKPPRRLFLSSGPRDWMRPSDTATMQRQKGAWKKLGGWGDGGDGWDGCDECWVDEP